MAFIFDIETNGLLEETTKIHSLVIYDTDTQKTYSCSNHSGYMPIEEGLKILSEASEICGHNIIKFDIPVIQKLYPNFRPKGMIFDTLLMSKLVYPDIGLIDDINIRKGKYMASVSIKNGKKKLIRGSYALFAWGFRLQEYKGDYCEDENCWVEWSSDMQRYCEQDVVVTTKLYQMIKSKNLSEEAVKLEHQFAQILFLQEQRGIYFDKEKAIDLASKLVEEKSRIEQKLRDAFPNEIKEETFIPKVNNAKRGYIKGKPFIKRVVVEFNPASRQMIAERLIKKYDWKPKKLSDTGLPVIDEEVLETLDYEEAPILKEYFLITKVLGQLVDGKNAWLKMVAKDGAIHGRVDTIGAVTGRCTHNSPNLAQVPSGDSFMGKECRELFKAREGYKLVGCDASGLELRCLAHYMNDEDYTNEILNGDIHTKNQIMAGLKTRTEAKRFIYAFSYGGGDELIGEICGYTEEEAEEFKKDKKNIESIRKKLIKQGRIPNLKVIFHILKGKKIKATFLQNLPKLNNLITGVQQKIKNKGYLKGLDKRVLRVREQYKGLNVLLQSCGAIVMKKALCILVDEIQAKGWKINEDIAFVLNVHDEYQAEVKLDLVEEYRNMAVEAIRKAGEYFNFRCPLDGEVKVGTNWYETH